MQTSIVIGGANGPDFTSSSNCTLIFPATAGDAIRPGSTPPIYDAADRRRRMWIDFHGDCCTPPPGCVNCGCKAQITATLGATDTATRIAAVRYQNISPPKVVGPNPVGPSGNGAMPDPNRLLFTLVVDAVIDPAKHYDLSVTFCSLQGTVTGSCRTKAFHFWGS